MSVVNVGGLVKYYGAEKIFSGIGFQAARGDKIGLVGVNGAGKSTLVKIIAGVESADGGAVAMARGTRVAYLAQEAQFTGSNTLMEEMHAALGYLTEVQRELTALEPLLAETSAPEWQARLEHYGELMAKFEHAGGYEIEHRIDRTLHGLGFDEEFFDQRVAQFSGGQKTRAALAAALLSDPDLLLLDEPTNHLDLAALEWLERFLKGWDGTLIVISHDRYFLDKVTNRTIEMINGRLDDYPGGYGKYMELKAERLELQLKHYTAQQEQIAKAEEFIRRFKAGVRSKEARGREKRLNRLKEGWTHADGSVERLVERPQDQKRLSLNLQTDSRAGEIVLTLNKLRAGYKVDDRRAPLANDRPLTNGAARGARGELTLITLPEELEVRRGQRVALIGPNGAGKTTLLKTIVGELPPLHGSVKLGHKVALNYYAQAHEGLNQRSTVLNEIWRVAPRLKETEARTFLGRFLFSGDDVFKQVGDLSGGERSRVALAQLTLLAGNLLVLDEPTNHLDIDARGALEDVLNEYQGTILFVSHDRYFIDAVADTIWEVADGAITTFEGTYSDYATYKERQEARKTTEPQRKPEPVSAKAAPQPAKAAAAPQPAKEDRKRQRKLSALEEEIAALETDLKKIEREMTAAGVRGDTKQVASLSMQYGEVHEMVQTRYDEWAALSG